VYNSNNSTPPPLVQAEHIHTRRSPGALETGGYTNVAAFEIAVSYVDAFYDLSVFEVS
jgi:hypothetical protein